MKLNRDLTLGILCLFLFAIMILIVDGSNVLYSSTTSVSVASANKLDLEEKNVDISDIAMEVSDRINVNSISSIATNIERIEVYKGMTIEELSAKLNKSLKGVLANKGNYIATKSLSLGVDPYMAVAIMLHETGCKWTCSNLAQNYNNVGGMRGASGWQKFDTIYDGIDGFLNNLSKNYIKKGLTTPETIVNKYAPGSKSWAGKIRKYMAEIEAK